MKDEIIYLLFMMLDAREKDYNWLTNKFFVTNNIQLFDFFLSL